MMPPGALTGDFVIRPARRADARAACDVVRRSIVELCEDDHQHDTDTLALWLANKTVANFEAWITSSSAVTLVADSASGLAGFGLLNLRKQRLDLLYVSPDARFRGVGKALLGAFEQEAIDAGLRELKLGSSATARVFYLSCGYAATGEPSAGFGLTQSYPMAKLLTPGGARDRR